METATLRNAIFDGALSEDMLIAQLDSRERWTQGLGSEVTARLEGLLDALESDEGMLEHLRAKPQALATCFAYAPPAQMLRLVYSCERLDAQLLPQAIDASEGHVQVIASWRYGYLRALTTMCRVMQQRHAVPRIEMPLVAR